MNKLGEKRLLGTLGMSVAILVGALMLSSKHASHASAAPQGQKTELSSKLEQFPQAVRDRANSLLRSPQAGFISGGGIHGLQLMSGSVPALDSVPPRSSGRSLPFESDVFQVMVNDPAQDFFAGFFDLSSQSEPAVAGYGSNVVVVYNDTGEVLFTGDGLGYSRSSDGGQTFTDMGAVPSASTGTTFSDPALAADRRGNFYAAGLAFDFSRPPGFESAIAISKSTDGGQTFSGPVYPPPTGVQPNSFQDKDFIAVDNSGGKFDGNVYVTWTSFVSPSGQFPSSIFFSRSTDGGLSFSSSIQLSVPGACLGPEPGVGPNGEVYVVYSSGIGFSPTFPSNILVVKSTDGGVTFGAPVVAAQSVWIGFTGERANGHCWAISA